MARLSIRSRLLCADGAILLLSSVPAVHLASVQGHNDVIRNLDNTISPDDAQRREDEVRRGDGRPEEGQYRRATSELRGYNRNGTDQGDYGDRRGDGPSLGCLQLMGSSG
jgi:hypothetical protein